MAVRSLNKVQLIGNLTRDPELRYTPNGTAVATFTVATNREWTVESGEKREEAEFTRVVAWNKLAELCSQLLSKGRKVYVEGRLQTRSWTGQDGAQRTSTEVVISDMIVLDSRRTEAVGGEVPGDSHPGVSASSAGAPVKKTQTKKALEAKTTSDESSVLEDKSFDKAQGKQDKLEKQEENTQEVNPDDIPF